MAKTFRIQPLREGGLPNLNRLVGEVNKEFDRIARAIDDILAGRATFTGNLNLGGFRATNAGNPRGAQDLVTLDYAEDSLGGGSTDADLTSEGEGGGSTSDGTSEQSDGGDDYLSLLDNVAATGVVFGEDDGGGGAILQTDVSNFVWNDTYDILMVGRSALGSTGTVASGIVSQRSVEAIGDGTDGNMRCTSYGAVPQWLSRKTLGTEALPTAVTAGTELFQIRSEGAYSVTPDWAQGFRFQIWAAENWTSGNNGSYLTLALTPIGTGPTTTEVLRLVPENAEATPLITLMGDTDTGIWHPAADTLALSVGAAEIMRWTTGAVTVNEDGDDVDFRVETTGVPNGFVVDFGANKVGMNNVLYTWPTAFVGAGTLLVDTDGAGTLAWETLATAGVSARPHNFLDSAEHNNVTTAVPVRGDVITGQGVTPTWTRLAVGVNNQILKNDETDVVWGKVDLADTTAEITGTLPYSNGGTGQTAWAQGDLLYASAANTLALLNVGVVNTVLVSNGTVPGWSATLAGLTLTSPTIGDFTNAGHNHEAAGGGGQLDHGAALTGLTDDDHTQYALLLGRSGGQILIGGVDASDDLTLYSTSDATKGNVIFGLAGTSVYDEVNSRWGIGTAAPEFQCHVVGSGAGTLSGWSWLFDTPNVVIQSDGSGRAAGLALVGGSGGCYLYMGDNSGTPEVDWGGLVYSNTHYLYFRANDATRATLTPTGLFQTTGGFKTTVAGPTVPFDPDGNNTLCTSLNADLLDGYEATTLPIAGDVTGTLAASVVGKINGVAYNADPLAQYLLLAGRAGAANDFTLSTSTDGNITGSSAASADLYLHGNSNDQAGLIRLQDELYLREDFPTIGAGETKYAACFNPTVTTSGASSSVMRCFCINPTLLLTAAASFVDGFYFNPTVTNSAPYVYTCVTNTGTHTSTYTGAGQGTVTVFNNTVTCQTAAASGKISNVLAFQDSGIVKVNNAVTAATLASLRSFRSAPVVNAVASGTINVTDVYGYLAEGTASGSGTKNVTNRYGYYVKNFSGATALTNQYGIYIEALTSGATINTSLVSAGTSTQMRHAGPVYIGASATAPTEKLHIGSGNLRIEGGSSTGFINLGEYNTTSDPSAPADNRVILYCRDNGAGKEQLCARFNTGAVQVLATEP